MTAIDLQNELIREIPRINNISTLESLKFIINQDETPVVLTEFQKKLIAKSEEDIKNGNVVEHSEAMKRIAQKYGW
jgi:predicted transcriptional regulator